MRPRLLRPDNLTPPTRTPWGGDAILSHYKAGLGLATHGVVGESWEVSIEPSFPSRFADDDTLLRDAIASDPEAWLGRYVAERYGGQTPLLVKLLDAAENLSVQVHPEDGDPELREGESGKPEAWIVLDARQGAGLYLGFREGVGLAEVSACLETQGHLADLMNFVPVVPGDAFMIAAGTPHAVGAGVTLIEPQFVAPGRRGVTYRFWDWNRRYNAEGKRDPKGRARSLHVARSLAVSRWTEGDSVASARASSEVLEEGGLSRTKVIDWPWFVTERWRGTGTLKLPAIGTMWALCTLGGSAVLRCGDTELSIQRGQSAVVPACAGALEVVGQGLDLVATYSPTSSPQ